MSSMTPQSETYDKTKKNTLIWLIVSQFIAGLILIPWCGLAMFAAMIGWPYVFELEGGWDFLAVLFSLIIIYPLYAVVPTIFAWFLYAKQQYKSATIVTILPVILILLLVLLWLVAGFFAK